MVAGIFAACTAPGDRAATVETTLTVSAAASLQDALQEIARAYESAYPGVGVRLNFAASGTLQQQIRMGAPVDVFLSAAEAPMDALQARGLIDADSRAAFAANRLVLIVPREGRVALRSFADLASPAVRRIAIGAPASVPAGLYARDVLRSLGIEEAVRPKLILAQHVRQVLTYVERGEVDAGIVYRTDVADRSSVRVVAGAPPGAHPPITYPVAIISGSPYPEEARRFATYLLGPEAQAVLSRFGFEQPRAHSASTVAPVR